MKRPACTPRQKSLSDIFRICDSLKELKAKVEELGRKVEKTA